MPTVHLPPGNDLKAAGFGVVQAVGVAGADGGPNAHDAGPKQRQRVFQQDALQAIAPPVRVDDDAVGIGPALPLGLRNAHERSVVVLTVPAVPQDKVGPQPLAVPCAKAEVVFEIALDIFQRIGHEQLRVRHHGSHLVLEPVDGLGLFACTLPERDRQRRRPAADLMKTKFHFCNPSQNKIILSLRFQYKCHFKECQFMLY